MSGERVGACRGRRRVAASPGMRPLGQLTLADDLQALAARDADAGDEEQGSAAEGDQDAVVDAVVVDVALVGAAVLIGCGLIGHVGRPTSG